MSFLTFLAVLAFFGTVLALAMMWLVNMPQSPLRDVLVQVIGWLFACFCAFYVISPIDILPEAFLGPFGLVDDVGAAVAGVMSAMAAYRAGQSAKAAKNGSTSCGGQAK
jgi:uncharacterized membrane protein YkvA (DUF1232 family)